MTASFTMKQHDTLPTRTFTIVQTNPVDPTGPLIPVDLTNAVSAKLIVSIDPSVMPRFTSALAFTGLRTSGQVTWTPISTDTAVSGKFLVEIQVTWASGEPETFPNDSYGSMVIVPDLGT